eukprot:3021769-Ditylum_brightwellii.AAC.1
MLNRGTEFIANFMEMIQRDYGVTERPITAQNLQSYGIVGRIHQTIGNMLLTFCVHSTKLEEEDPWSGILGALMFAMGATRHSASRATPAQLVRRCDTMLNVQHEANMAYRKERRNKTSSKNNKQENATYRKHEYDIN